ncbi:Sin3 histone deacetylase corepressor complex component SDS3 [Portunus trituberculatus]|uniref:Sin3 histone deacetylase corepressor complex component SDS3 n=1 Tax=Portunus trituberculatus TaxID=210409 RepID=A0A5B7J5K7_PORTR|nr:Sin3 histone deacetylase corepressor complex component SDS3 [Portunus trituberculatus]
MPSPADAIANEPKIENGKLYFDKKWFHKGQAVMIECKDGTRFNAILTVASGDMVSGTGGTFDACVIC